MSAIPYIAAGFKEDFQKFLSRFESIRFAHFANMWKEMKLSFLFCRRESECELLEFTEEVLMIVVGYFTQFCTFQVKAAALYFLYAVYMKQKLEVKAKIRITLDQWNELQNFLTEIKADDQHDLHYVYRQLELKNAFHFVCFQREHTPLHRTMECTESQPPFMIRSLVDEGKLKDLQEIHNRYSSVMKKLTETGQLRETAYIAPDLMSNFMKKLDDFDKMSSESQNECGQQSNENNSRDEEIGHRRRMLKKKIMQETTAASRSDHHRHPEVATSLGGGSSGNENYDSETAGRESNASMPVLS